jgi:hypothetical protein
MTRSEHTHLGIVAAGASALEPTHSGCIPLYYWEKKKNFGDLIAPWLITLMTGMPTVNVKNRLGESGLASVGSVITMFDRPGLHVWGSGTICTLDSNHLKRLSVNSPSAIYAVRGWKTYKEITSKLGWKAPRVFGDPALLLPRFFSPASRSGTSGPVAVCPHYSHKRLFSSQFSDGMFIVNVEEEAELVVNQIANSAVCVSTSLHGLVVAHAYEVPWVWLEIQDNKLSGTNFKFEDFFTVLDREAVRHVKLAVGDLTSDNLKRVAATATLPKSKFSFGSLLNAFPLSRLGY